GEDREPGEPAREVARELAEREPGPAVVPALHREARRKLGAGEGQGRRPDEREDGQGEDGHPRTGGGHHLLEAVGPAGEVRVGYEDELEGRGRRPGSAVAHSKPVAGACTTSPPGGGNRDGLDTSELSRALPEGPRPRAGPGSGAPGGGTPRGGRGAG